MRLTRSPRKWIAVLLLVALAFTQASVALADCPMERGSIGAAPAAESSETCECDIGTEIAPLWTNLCFAHCTSDLQLFGSVAVAVNNADHVSGLVAPRATQPPHWRRQLAPPAATVPKRIQLHSFLV